MDILDLAFYYFVHSLKKYSVDIPHSAKVYASCKILNLDMSSFVGVRIDRGKDKRSINLVLEKLNGSFSVQPSSLPGGNDFCLIDSQLYDETGEVLYKLRKYKNFIFQTTKAISYISHEFMRT